MTARVCCGKDSALEDSAHRADPKSLKDVAAKLQGRHLLSDGRPIMVTSRIHCAGHDQRKPADYTLRTNTPLLMEWNSHLYVCTGSTYRWIYDPEHRGRGRQSIRKFLLIDTRYSDSRREVVFNRDTDDWSKVQGFAICGGRRRTAAEMSPP